MKAEEKINQYKENAKDFVGSLKDHAYDARDYIVEKGTQFKAKAVDTGEYVDNYVRDNPWKAVGIGVVTGIVVAKLLDLLRK